MSTATIQPAREAGDEGAALQPEQAATLGERVRALAAGFRERAAQTELDGSVPRESMDELIGAGMARMLVPKAYGGLEMTIRDFAEATAAAAYGCPSTGWCGGQMAFAGLVVAQFPTEVQQTVWADGPDVVFASTAIGFTATPVDGGYTLSGRGPFASGVRHATWLYLGAPVLREGQPPEMRFLLVRREDATVLDTWDMAAMRGTGSNTIVIEDVFVPEACTLPFAAFREATGPGSLDNRDNLYHLPWVSVVPLTYVATVLGAAESAYDQAVTILSGKRGPGGTRSADSEVLQLEMGFASAKLDAARTLMGTLADRADNGAGCTVRERARAMRDATFIVCLALEATDAVVEATGTTGFASSSVIQRGWRDAHFASAHQALNKRLIVCRYGMLELGGEEKMTPLFY